MNTTEVGNTFRDSVADLLRMTPGLSNVTTERPVGSQAVDVYYEEETSTGTLKVACECKKRARPLTRSRIETEIAFKYGPLKTNRLVDRVRIISPLDIGVQARKYVNEDLGFSFDTIHELESKLINFQTYVRSIRLRFTEDGLNQYYIHPVLRGGEDLAAYLDKWIRGETARPIAILAGYGMGKTSFATHLAHVAAEAHERDPSERIPILVPLAEISSEQSLEGLLGKIFGAHNKVRNWHFDLFMELNRRGRFLVILDGFDEMKHTMKWREFTHNIGELHRLVERGSRVVLLGRLTAFMNDIEEFFVLRGQRKTWDGRVFSVDGAPVYEELELQPFTERQAVAFITKYAAYKITNDAATRDDAVPAHELDRRLADIPNDENLKGLIERPVQAKMIADLATDTKVEWRSFTRYELYDEFVSRILIRENRKPTRHAFSEEDRRTFVELIAWWLWLRGGPASFDAADLPHDIPERFMREELDADADAVTRDLLVGSLLERKSGDKYFFPHRSFLEFLVSRHIATTQWPDDDLVVVAHALNPEIAAFLKESGHDKQIAAWGDRLDGLDSVLPLRFLELVASSMNICQIPHPAAAPRDGSPATILLNYFRLAERKAPTSELLRYLVASFNQAAASDTRTMCLLALMLARQSSIVDFHAKIGRILIASILSEALPGIERTMNKSDPRHWRDVAENADDLYLNIVTLAFRGQKNPGGGSFVVTVEWEPVFESLCREQMDGWELDSVFPSVAGDEEKVALGDLGNHVEALRLTQSGGRLVVPFLSHISRNH